jgi:hypothetical protein
MLNLLKIEWLKIKYYRTFWILSSLYVLCILGINYFVFYIQQQIYQEKASKGMANTLIGHPPYSFPTVWQMTAYVTSFLLFIPGLLVIISVTNEYSFKTHRQNIIDGWSRTQFITAKLMLPAIIAIISTIMVIIAGCIFGLAEGSQSFSLEGFQYIGYFFIQALSYSCVALLFSVLFKRSGIAIGVFFLYAFFIENIAGALLNHYANYAGRYLPLETTDNLIPLPVLRMVQKQFIPDPNYTVLFILSLVYLALYVFFIRRKFEKDDL